MRGVPAFSATRVLACVLTLSFGAALFVCVHQAICDAMAVRAAFEKNNEIGCFAKLTNTYCLVAIGGAENFYRLVSELRPRVSVGWPPYRPLNVTDGLDVLPQCVRRRVVRKHPGGPCVNWRMSHHRTHVCG